jgi:FkbM family methyltransferase
MLLNLIELIKKYNMKIKGVIQIGSHYGEENQLYNLIGIKNRIFFEPLNSNFSVLEKNIEPIHTLVKKALGNENKKVSMYTEEKNSGQSSSILKPMLHLKQYPNIVFNNTEIVDMIKLDSFEKDLTEYNFIVIDVQGYELEVFKGAKNTLDNIDYIISEINRDELYENCAKIEQLVEFLSNYGFEFIEHNWIGGTWGDGLFIKKGK